MIEFLSFDEIRRALDHLMLILNGLTMKSQLTLLLYSRRPDGLVPLSLPLHFFVNLALFLYPQLMDPLAYRLFEIFLRVKLAAIASHPLFLLRFQLNGLFGVRGFYLNNDEFPIPLQTHIRLTCKQNRNDGRMPGPLSLFFDDIL